MRLSDLHKRVLAQPKLDPDALAFLTAAGITDATIKNAINNLVKSLKTNNIWIKMKAIYPFVGGTETTHKYNLKDPRDLDVAFRLDFVNSWNHTSNGAQPVLGTNASARTFFVPSNELTINSAHFAKYNRTNDTAGVKVDGVRDGSSNFLSLNYSGGTGIIGSQDSIASYTVNTTTGLFIVSRTSSSLVKVFRRGIEVANNTISILNMANGQMLIGARTVALTVDSFNTYEAAYASIGEGLSDSESVALNNIVQSFQTTLGRQV
jgi:hypothetical protein